MARVEEAHGSRTTHDVVGRKPSIFEPKGAHPVCECWSGVCRIELFGDAARRLKCTLYGSQEASNSHDLALTNAALRYLGGWVLDRFFTCQQASTRADQSV